ncbi:MAG: hypothetical protein WCS77_03650 [Elusimicrobiaceae bacterium]
MKKAAAVALLFFCAASFAGTVRKDAALYTDKLLELVTEADTILKDAQEQESSFYRRLGWQNGKVRGLIDLKTLLSVLEKRQALARYYDERKNTLPQLAGFEKSGADMKEYFTLRAKNEKEKADALAAIIENWKQSLASDEKTKNFAAEDMYNTLNFYPADKLAGQCRLRWGSDYQNELKQGGKK